MVYTLDGWKTTLEAQSKVVGYPGSYADIVTPGADAGGAGMVSFTLFWPAGADVAEHWLGHNVEVRLTEAMTEAVPAPK